MTSKEEAITTIPAIDAISGVSSGIMSQLRIAPETGTRNFQVFNSETFTPGRLSRVNQMAKAAADKKLNQAKDTKYAVETAFNPYPSIGIEMATKAKPPKNKEDELNTIGERFAGLRAAKTLVKPEMRLFVNKSKTPKTLSCGPELMSDPLKLIMATPTTPNKRLTLFRPSILSLCE